jgi:integrase
MARSRGVYNRIFSEEKWALVSKENKDILDDFLTEYKQQKKSQGTIDGYYQDLRIVLIKIMEDFGNKSILEMSKKDFRRLNIWFDESGMSPARCNRIHSATNSLLTYCEEDDDYEYEVNTSKKVKGVPREKVKTNEDNFFFTFEEFIKVRDKLVEMGDLQNAVMWSLAFDSAGRKNEVMQVTKYGLLDGNKTNIVRGKRGKLFPLVYLDDTKELIRQYLEWRGEDNVDSLWISGKGETARPITIAALYDRILKCNSILEDIRGEETNIFFHTCRHSRIECLLQGTDDRIKDENGNNKKFPLEQIMVLAHHSDVSTTQSYCKNHDEDTINEMFGF